MKIFVSAKPGRSLQMRDLFDATRLKNVVLKNRFVRSATWERLATDDGRMNARLFRIYEDLAKGQVGLIITSYTFVTQDEQPNPGMLGIYDDRGQDEYRDLTDMVHRHGSAIVMQLVYGGTQTLFRPETRTILGPSAVAEMATGVVAKPMSQEEIRMMVQAFGDAAVRAKKAGFDGVQLHCAHGYFFSQWLNPYHNRRADEYGGSIENRARIILETSEEVRRRCGEDFLVMAKINSQDFVPGGTTFEDCRYVCKELARRGVDAIEVSGGILASDAALRWSRPLLATPADEAYFADYAAQIAEEIDVPVILVGGLKSFEVVERLLAETKISYFALSRALMTEPDLVQRWRRGDRSKAKCTSCNQCRDPKGNICILHRKS
jgi:2,4-dienoyl-CoA reductase-like NADH-dependent reductase (Old Yellow Enzyme family)